MDMIFWASLWIFSTAFCCAFAYAKGRSSVIDESLDHKKNGALKPFWMRK